DALDPEFDKVWTRRGKSRSLHRENRSGSGLLPHYLLTAFRKIRRQKLFSAVNIAGLAVGLACCAVIILYVVNELSYDRFHPASDRIYRIASHTVNAVGETTGVATGNPMAPTIRRDFPQAEEVVRITPPPENADHVLAVCGEKRFFENRVWFADESVFNTFRIPFLQGDSGQALRDPFSVVLTESTARKYFGVEPVLGKTVRLEIDYDTGATELEDFRVTGVVRDAPRNTHFKYDLLLSGSTLLRHLPDYDTNYLDHHYDYTYVRLAPSADPAAFGGMLRRIAEEGARVYEQRFNRPAGKTDYFLQPVASIHMRSRFQGEIDPPGNWTYISIYSLIALLILLIGCLNFINLSAALSATRTKEVGLRKVIGAARGQLVRQFLGESFLVTFLAFLISLGLMAVLLVPFNRMAGTELTLAGLTQPAVLLSLVALLFLVAFGSGAYPAFLLTSFRPAVIFRGELDPASRGAWVQKALVIGQFAVSIFLVICSVTAFRQLGFMRGQALGFDLQNKIVLPVQSNVSHLRRDYEAIKRDFLAHPDILAATVSSSVPGDLEESGYYLTTREGDFRGAPRLLVNTVDFDFIPSYGLKMIAGRAFDPANRSDLNEAFVINRAGLKELGILRPEEAVGKRFQAHYNRRWKTIIGVVEDFHYRGMRETVRPLLLDIEPSLMDTLTLSVRTSDPASLMTHVRSVWENHFPGVPFAFSYLSERFDRLYRYEEQMGNLLALTTILGLVIACLGLFGLAYFIANLRRKEIGIRRVLGASQGDVVALLSKRFAGLVLLSALLAGLPAWFAVNRWLQDFAYRVRPGGFVFAAAAAGALAIALATVGLQGWKAARRNPVDSLRNE
ncbi:MAG: ABC transporter permease, partial [Candidatus Aminicenantes bacterium]|nr:ABC transporter permease [Candidatus Aminicenantes bacterium]